MFNSKHRYPKRLALSIEWVNLVILFIVKTFEREIFIVTVNFELSDAGGFSRFPVVEEVVVGQSRAVE